MTKAKQWYLWSVIMGFAILGACWWTVWEECGKAKMAENGQRTTENKTVKVYPGKWTKEGYLEVIGK